MVTEHSFDSCKNYSHKPFFFVQSFSYFWLFATHGLQPARICCPSPSPRACSNSCPLSWWYHPTISSSVIRFSSCIQSFPASGSFPVSRLFPSGGQSIGASASASVLPMNNPMNWLLWSPWGPRDSQASFPAPQLEASILWHSTFIMVQLSHTYMCCAVLSHSVISDSLWPHGP